MNKMEVAESQEARVIRLKHQNKYKFKFRGTFNKYFQARQTFYQDCRPGIFQISLCL